MMKNLGKIWPIFVVILMLKYIPYRGKPVLSWNEILICMPFVIVSYWLYNIFHK